MAPIILYFSPRSAPSRGALLTIRNLKLDVEIKTIHPAAKEQLAPSFVKINPQHVVPTIIDSNGFVLWESRAIASYLVETKASGGLESLYPADLKLRALCNQRLYFDAGTLYQRIRNICYPALYLGETKISADKRQQLDEAFKFMEVFLDGSKWFVGDNVTIADLAILASLSSILAAGASIKDYPNIQRWYEQCHVLEGFEENAQGAKMFGDAVKSKLEDSF